jgi:hypothetical protein
LTRYYTYRFDSGHDFRREARYLEARDGPAPAGENAPLGPAYQRHTALSTCLGETIVLIKVMVT